MTPQSIGLIVIGIISLMMGYSLFRSMLPVWGFILGGWIAFTLLPTFFPGEKSQELLIQVIGFVVGGVIGALISTPLYFAIIFLSGAVLGVIFGTFVGAFFDVGVLTSFNQLGPFLTHVFPPIPGSTLEYVFSLLGAVLLGITAMSFQKFMIIASSSFLGAAAILTGLSVPIARSSQSLAAQSAVMLAGLVMIGLLGIFIQFRLGGEI